ncbi:hypothetical protein EHQ12_17945 [Leptospira gomenensis]|uniref:MORN repeat protein n=1 Tax=Leptospira gomenensis TaxID=2484974 RepID=A0A5F1YCT3_9LEPT|nr:hypothetical protein [Leptospira gomenensis]TGK33218.1 hypothetical protein EHQ12_17945 [Leptospira gomenensis]TGK35604.1 hypothetical protein EHQ17_06380 [Leptospira gomenensis]TGK40920.1 hypothetical protein EHQ07_17340 [Leptospira gomenensis]TGK61209.1 hypothetical protein EHQ13_09875 [Leptospira gomenensis]
MATSEMYSKIIILLKSADRIRNVRNGSVLMFLFIYISCSSGDKKLSPDEPANTASRSAAMEEQTASDRSTIADPGNAPGKGCIQGDCVNGRGTYVYDNDDEYSGSFQNDMRNGSGRMKYANGDKFEGTFKDDVKEGNGTYIFRNGSILEGNFQNGTMIGMGKVRFPDTSVYEGEFQDEKNSASGTLSSSFDGSKKQCRVENKIVLCGGTLGETGNIDPLH